MKETRTKAKEKLAKMRKNRGFTQKEMASKMNMQNTTYNKREKGKIKIKIEEWEKLAEILGCNISDILEEDFGQIIICKDQSIGNNWGVNYNYTVPASLLESQQDLVTMLKDENTKLKNENLKFSDEIKTLEKYINENLK